MTRSKREFLKIYFAFFLPAICLPLILSIAYYSKESNHLAALLQKRELFIIEKQQALINKKIFSVVSDLKILASHRELYEAVNSPSTTNLAHLTYEFLQFCRHKTIYDQVRYIDMTGREAVRINYNNGDPAAVPADRLQDKSKRYYFLDTIRLGNNEIFISPFDLNIENGKIEAPLKPMIRFGMPVFNNDLKKVGIIILNYFGIDLLNTLGTEQGRIMLVNANGHWLKAMNPEDEWGFMFKGRSDKIMQNRFPDAWRQIKDSNTGQFYTEDGLFTYATINPLGAEMKSSLGSAKAYVSIGTPVIAPDDYYWKIIARVSPEYLSQQKNDIFENIGMINGSLFLLLAAGCFFITREFQKRKETDLNLQQTKATLQSVFNSVIPICVTNFDYEILLANQEYIITFNDKKIHREREKIKCYESRPGPICKTEACPLQRIADGEEEVTFEATKTSDNNENHHFIVTARPLYNEEAVPIGIVESFLDITERDKLEKEVKTLSGFLPICASCKKIRDDQGFWNQIESYISSHSEAEFSHGICPGCVQELYPEQYKLIFPEKDES
jgi:PAS domain-containing protein